MARHIVATVLVSLSLTTVAHGQEYERDEEFDRALDDFKTDFNVETCRWVSILAKDVMTKRQGYEPMSETLPFAFDRLENFFIDPGDILGEFGRQLDDEDQADWSVIMEAFRQDTRPLITEMVMSAYDVPTYGIESNRRDAINEFENGMFEACYRGAEMDSQLPLEPNEEAELRRLEEERRRAEDAGLLDQYIQLIQDRIERAWNPPPSAGPGLQCEVSVTQIPSGDVTSVSVGRCNGDAAVIRSIEQAVQRASPLPPPPTPSLFSRNLELVFQPDA